ncbi:GNAT family N-acetyltransferase [Rugosimonospora acidiphila]|uniref:GNAT family N-acetyltransferase n=1 Tax=Rugosimonospora acidiphila TaxID=556531 RepID=A0ABP9RQE2_9ACTN
MVSDEYVLRTGTPEDFEPIHRLLTTVFHDDPDEGVIDLYRAVFEPARAVVAYHGDILAGSASAYTRDLAVPGAVVPSAHVTGVGVEPTHRRHGLLNRMMGHLLADARRLGEPVAHLWASEGKIYQRYGYGLAACRLMLNADREVQLREPPHDSGRLRSAVPADVVADLRKVYDQALPGRPGWSSRHDRLWHRITADPKSWRHGGTAMRAVLHETAGGIDGYALWRGRNREDDGPGTVDVREVVAADPAGYRALWHFLLNMDLTRRTQFTFAAIDEPLLYLVNEPTALGARLEDALWLRLVDVPAALAARRYPVPVDVVLRTEDPLLPENSGNWHLIGGPDRASCTRTDRPADLDFELGALGAVYLGGTPLGTLAAGGRLRELTPGTLVGVDAAFRWHRAPAATEIF